MVKIFIEYFTYVIDWEMDLPKDTGAPTISPNQKIYIIRNNL